MMDTEMQRSTEAELARLEGRNDVEAFLAERTRRIPLGRRAEIAEVAASVVWLALDAPAYMTAERLNMSAAGSTRTERRLQASNSHQRVGSTEMRSPFWLRGSVSPSDVDLDAVATACRPRHGRHAGSAPWRRSADDPGRRCRRRPAPRQLDVVRAEGQRPRAIPARSPPASPSGRSSRKMPPVLDPHRHRASVSPMNSATNGWPDCRRWRVGVPTCSIRPLFITRPCRQVPVPLPGRA